MYPLWLFRFRKICFTNKLNSSFVDKNFLARVEQAKQAFNDQAQGRFNIELVEKLQRNLEISNTKIERYHVFHQGLPQGGYIFRSFGEFHKLLYQSLENSQKVQENTFRLETSSDSEVPKEERF